LFTFAAHGRALHAPLRLQAKKRLGAKKAQCAFAPKGDDRKYKKK
jgi:hypothetical protein